METVGPGRGVRKLEKLAAGNTPTRVSGIKLGRTPGAVQQKASQEKISLKPTNQSPYNRQKMRLTRRRRQRLSTRAPRQS